MSDIVFHVSEIFPSVQGEGVFTGTIAVFVRLAGCPVRCPFCDTAYALDVERAARTVSLPDLVTEVRSYNIPHVVITGGEPMAQPVEALVKELRKGGDCKVELETSGVVRPNAVNTLTMRPEVYLNLSPKISRSRCKVLRCMSLKVLYPYITCQYTGETITAESYEEGITVYGGKYLQPLDDRNIKETIDKLYSLPGWRLGVQVHKRIGVR